MEGFIFKSFKTFLLKLYYNKNILEYREFFLRVENKFKLKKKRRSKTLKVTFMVEFLIKDPFNL